MTKDSNWSMIPGDCFEEQNNILWIFFLQNVIWWILWLLKYAEKTDQFWSLNRTAVNKS